jgi:hypothetical protein
MLLLDRIEVSIEWLDGRLVARQVVAWEPDPVIPGTLHARYGPNMLPKTCKTVPAAKVLVERACGSKTQKLVIVDNATRPRTLNDRAVASPRDNYGFRSAGR